jgi:hypothetical protein
VSPADALSSFFSTAARVKALQRWGSFWSWCPCHLALVLAMVTTEEGDGVGDDRWPLQVQKIYRILLYYSFSLGFFVQMCVDSCSLCMFLVGACIVWVLYTYAAWYNTGIFYQ